MQQMKGRRPDAQQLRLCPQGTAEWGWTRATGARGACGEAGGADREPEGRSQPAGIQTQRLGLWGLRGAQEDVGSQPGEPTSPWGTATFAVGGGGVTGHGMLPDRAARGVGGLDAGTTVGPSRQRALLGLRAQTWEKAVRAVGCFGSGRLVSLQARQQPLAAPLCLVPVSLLPRETFTCLTHTTPLKSAAHSSNK